MIWINGVATELVSVSDRSVQFGDGCFTTARVLAGKIQWLSAHINRLQKASRALGIVESDWKQLEYEMINAGKLREEGVVKVIISRGQGGRGYSTLGCNQPTRIVSVTDYPQYYHHWREQGIRLTLSPIMLSQNSLLAGIKHLNRLEQVMIRMHLEQTDAQEALVVDTSGRLVECCSANLFWRKGSQVYTPDLSLSGVAGIMRQNIIDFLRDIGRFENMPNYSISIVSEMPETLSDADEVLVCNALMPVLSVKQIDSWYYSSTELYDFCTQFIK